MSVAALPGGMLGARSRLRPLLLPLDGRCASCYNNNNLFYFTRVIYTFLPLKKVFSQMAPDYL